MRTLAEFTKTTLIGGVLIILPIYISILLIAKAISGILNMVKPITTSIPASVEFREVLAILVQLEGHGGYSEFGRREFLLRQRHPFHHRRIRAPR